MAMNLSPDTRLSTTDYAAAKGPPPSPEEMAERFPNFEITECLGRGGMGVVYKARQKALDREVAIKVLAGEWQDDRSFAKRFEREAKTLAQMSHPNIVTVHDFGEADGLYYIVMEYVDGVNLRDLLSDGKMAPEQALAIVPPICEALEYAHGKGLVHRDIKPENLLLDRDGRVMIADFGIASLVGVASDISGTPSYMAPEQYNGSVDRRADIYALGVVLYEMLTGKRPEKDVVAPSRKVEVDVKIDEIVLRALEKEPERRYQTAAEFRTTAELAMTTPHRVASKGEEMNSSQSVQGEWKAPDSGWGWFIGKLFGTTFTSPAAYRIANLSALGFLGSLGFLGYLPVSGAKVLFALYGLYGLFGLIGLAFMIELPHQKNSGPSGDTVRAIPINWKFGLVIGAIVAAAVMAALAVINILG
jgi:serine/threonine protein kinase